MKTTPSEPDKGRVETKSLGKLSRGELKSAIIGMVIGDGCLSKKKKKDSHNASIQMSHSENQLKYMEWKKNIIDQIAYCRIIPNNTKKCSFNGKSYKGYHLSSRVNPLFTGLYNRFYHCGHKCVDEYLVKMITPLALAIIYMDDGTLGKANPQYWTKETFFLRLCNFDYANLFLIKKSLKIKYDLDWNINRHTKKFYHLRLLNKHNQKFVDIIRPYIEMVPSMIYKLGSYANQMDNNSSVI